MGSLLIQVGQCGNQVGMQIWENLLQQQQNYDVNFLFDHQTAQAHCIMIDTEPKVIKKIIDDRKKYAQFDIKNVIYHQDGRANNWAVGYNDSKKILQKKQKMQQFQILKEDYPNAQVNPEDKYFKENSSILENTQELIRKEIEKIDYYMGTMFIYSLGGGTGSGLGSRILEEMSDDYSDGYLFNTVVFPSTSGENPLQHYNCLHSINSLQEHSDGIIYYQNDKINSYLGSQIGKNIENNVNIININQFIASHLSQLFKINDSKNQDRFYVDIINELCAMQQTKFLETFSAPFQFNKYSPLLKQSKQNLGLDSTWDNICNNIISQAKHNDNFVAQKDTNKSIGAFSLCQSSDIQKSLLNNQQEMTLIDKKLRSCFNVVEWNSDGFNLEYLKQGQINDQKSIFSIINRTNISAYLQDINQKAYIKYKSKAYLHWYHKYGLETSDFESSFQNIENIIENYELIKYS